VAFPSFGDPLVDRLAAGETLGYAVPVSDAVLAKFPAEQNNLSIYFAREVEQANIEIFNLNTDGVDFGEGVFDSVDGFLALCFPTGKMNDVNRHAAAEKNVMREVLGFFINRLDQAFAIDGRTQQGFKNGEKGLGFIESEGTVSHTQF
jgi:hypothetical protein